MTSRKPIFGEARIMENYAFELSKRDLEIHSLNNQLTVLRLKLEVEQQRHEATVAALNAATAALRDHACPDDGSTDTVCYPNNHKCKARLLGRAVHALDCAIGINARHGCTCGVSTKGGQHG